MSDQGQTHSVGDSCPGGHLSDQTTDEVAAIMEAVRFVEDDGTWPIETLVRKLADDRDRWRTESHELRHLVSVVIEELDKHEGDEGAVLRYLSPEIRDAMIRLSAHDEESAR